MKRLISVLLHVVVEAKHAGEIWWHAMLVTTQAHDCTLMQNGTWQHPQFCILHRFKASELYDAETDLVWL